MKFDTSIFNSAALIDLLTEILRKTNDENMPTETKLKGKER